MKTTNPSPDRRGFTLIELLAVVAIILLLLSFLVPALSRVKEKAERTVCINNIRQLGSAFESFAGDNAGNWPSSYRWAFTKQGGTVNGLWAEWARSDVATNGQIYTYINDPRAYICPTFVRTFQQNPAAAGLTPYCTYTVNEYIRDYSDPKWGLQYALQRSMVQKPAAQGVIGEEATWLCPPYSSYIINNMRLGVGTYQIGQPLGRPTSPIVDSVTDFHGPDAFDVEKGYSYVVFADGHVDSVLPKESKEVMTPDLKKLGTGGF